MHENNVYNLMMQSIQEHKSLWRIVNDYQEDATGDEELLAFWENLAREKAEQVAELQRLISARSIVEGAGEETESTEDAS